MIMPTVLTPPRSESAARALNKDEINELPLLAYEGDILLAVDEASLDAALDILENERILGFDTETRPSFKRGKTYPTTLVQLAGAELTVLIQLVRAPFSERLAALLGNPSIIKAGVAIQEDMRGLRKMRDFEPAAVVDLADMARNLRLHSRGLRTLAAEVMGVRISKAAQCSNWGKKDLSQQQIKYAATDAWIGRQLYLRLSGLSGH